MSARNIVSCKQWNPIGQGISPRLAYYWLNLTGQQFKPIRPASYMQVSNLINTSGCSATPPYWGWHCMGVLETQQGMMVIAPTDWMLLWPTGRIEIVVDAEMQRLLTLYPELFVIEDVYTVTPERPDTTMNLSYEQACWFLDHGYTITRSDWTSVFPGGRTLSLKSLPGDSYCVEHRIKKLEHLQYFRLTDADRTATDWLVVDSTV